MIRCVFVLASNNEKVIQSDIYHLPYMSFFSTLIFLGSTSGSCASFRSLGSNSSSSSSPSSTSSFSAGSASTFLFSSAIFESVEKTNKHIRIQVTLSILFHKHQIRNKLFIPKSFFGTAGASIGTFAFTKGPLLSSK